MPTVARTLLLAALLPACSGGPCADLHPAPLIHGRLTTDGPLLRDEHGRVVILRGVNAGGRNKWSPYLPFTLDNEADFDALLSTYMDRIASWGINILRLPFSWEGIEPVRGAYDDTYRERLAAMVDAAWQRGMRVDVDFHQDVYASPFCGDGFPLWTLGPIAYGAPRRDCPGWSLAYFDSNGPVPAAFDRFWSNTDGLLDAFEAMWRTVASDLGGHDGVIGFEVINEPGWGTADITDFERDTLTPVIERIGNAIQESAPDALIFNGGSAFDTVKGTTDMTNPALSGFVYAPHFYEASMMLTGTLAADRSIRRQIESLAQPLIDWQRPVLFGEFNGANHAVDQLPYVRRVYDNFDELGVHATIWEASTSAQWWNDEDFSLLAADGSENPVVDEVVRPYPRAVAGTIDLFAWDRAALQFTLNVSGSDDRAQVSEIYLPIRHLGQAPQVTLVGGCHLWQAQSELLLVHAHESSWTLTVNSSIDM